MEECVAKNVNSHDMSPFKQHKPHLNDEVDPVILPDISEDKMVGSGRSLENLILGPPGSVGSGSPVLLHHLSPSPLLLNHLSQPQKTD